jgi:hypothetical protein
VDSETFRERLSRLSPSQRVVLRLRHWWGGRHRHEWVCCGFGRMCCECLTCGACRCEDGGMCSPPWCKRAEAR